MNSVCVVACVHVYTMYRLLVVCVNSVVVGG